jgi:hypothetical protein
MTNDIDVLRMATMEYDKAIKIKRINERLFEQLIGSLYYICKYAGRNNISLPNKTNIFEMVKSCGDEFNNIAESVSSKLPTENKHYYSPTESQQRNKATDEETEPKVLIIFNYFIYI